MTKASSQVRITSRDFKKNSRTNNLFLFWTLKIIENVEYFLSNLLPCLDGDGNVTRVSTSDADSFDFNLGEGSSDVFDIPKEQEVVRKSETLKKYENTMCDNWDFSYEKMQKDIKETDLTGPEYSPKASQVHKKDISIGNENLYKKSLVDSPDLNKAMARTVFNSTVDKGSSCGSNSPQLSIGEEALVLEDLEIVDGENDHKKHMIAEPPSPSDAPKAKLWSCFPAIKGSSRSSYKMMMQSPPYMPVARENTSRYVHTY